MHYINGCTNGIYLICCNNRIDIVAKKLINLRKMNCSYDPNITYIAKERKNEK